MELALRLRPVLRATAAEKKHFQTVDLASYSRTAVELELLELDLDLDLELELELELKISTM